LGEDNADFVSKSPERDVYQVIRFTSFVDVFYNITIAVDENPRLLLFNHFEAMVLPPCYELLKNCANVYFGL